MRNLTQETAQIPAELTHADPFRLRHMIVWLRLRHGTLVVDAICVPSPALAVNAGSDSLAAFGRRPGFPCRIPICRYFGHRKSLHITQAKVNRAYPEQYPPFPARICNKNPRYPRLSETNPTIAGLKQVSQDRPDYPQLTTSCGPIQT